MRILNKKIIVEDVDKKNIPLDVVENLLYLGLRKMGNVGFDEISKLTV